MNLRVLIIKIKQRYSIVTILNRKKIDKAVFFKIDDIKINVKARSIGSPCEITLCNNRKGLRQTKLHLRLVLKKMFDRFLVKCC